MNTDKNKLNIMVVDDEEKQCKILKILLISEGYYVRTANSADEALEELSREAADIVITDLRMGEKDGIQLLESVLKKYKSCKVILLTGYGSIESAVEAMKKGAWFYFIKGQGPSKLLEELQRLQKAHLSKNRFRVEQGSKRKKYMLETKSPKFQKVIGILERAAKSSANIMILGESGVGKEVMADYVHQISRPEKRFIGVNCHALSDTLMESELFGHEKGAFTGAVGTYKGRFEAVEGGTLFLDEIGDIPLHVQSKLLRVLETRSIERVGSTKSIQVDFRLISATNVDLERAIEEERFRGDLYYRLCTITVVVPPLRERKEDLPDLIRFFLEKYGEEQQKEIREPSQEVWNALLSYSYKGNIRELKNIIERLVVLSENGEISAEDLPEQFVEQTSLKKNTGGSLKEIRAQAEKDAILKALHENDYRIRETAEQLDIGERQLFYKLKEYNIDVKKIKSLHKI